MSKPRIVIFGAFDRHNFGDMLFAHVVARLLAECRPDVEPIFAGCGRRDLRAHGGHDVAALSQLAKRCRDEPIALIHAGGELLTCDAWEAAVMLKTPEEAQTRIARYGSRAEDRDAWARAELGTEALAPWHDDIAVYARLAARMRHAAVTIFESLNVWDICALIANSDGFAGSSLHGRIVATAYGLPRVNFQHADAAKQRAYAATWEIAEAPGVVPITDLHAAMRDALAMDRAALYEKASALAKAYRAGFEPVARRALRS